MMQEGVFFQKNFEVGKFLFETIGRFTFIQEGETETDAWQRARKEVIKNHQDNNPHLYEATFIPQDMGENPAAVPTEKPVERPKDQIGGIMHDIGTCQDLKVLDTYAFFVKNRPELQEAYNKKLAELKGSM
jgi:hypothetical protein